MSMPPSRRDVVKSLGAGSALAVSGAGRALGQTAETIVFGGSIPMSGKEGNTGLNVLQGYKVAI